MHKICDTPDVHNNRSSMRWRKHTLRCAESCFLREGTRIY